MANEEHVEVVRNGRKGMAEWRKANPDARLVLSSANLRGINLKDADLRGADFRDADLSGADLARSDLIGADLRGANLSNARLIGSYLRGANLSSACLNRANLTTAHLLGAYFHGAFLVGAHLSNADLSDANLNRIDLRDAFLRGASLIGANLSNAYLRDADLSGAHFAFTALNHVDLSVCKGLSEVFHAGPSSMGIDTLYLSRGEIPEVFLRGCGVPEDMIAYARSISGAVQFYSCFISYSHEDEEFARRLHSRMQQEKLRVWFAPEDMPGGKKLHEEIDRAIRLHDRLLVVLSPNSMGSEWVATEIRKARKRELKEKRRVLFPIRLVSFEAIRDWELFDADSGKDLAVELREYCIPDFSNWKDHDAFEREFAKLLRDLRRGEARS